ncbi:MAG TPA: 3'-5' exonuclease [Longimicrobium sp.]|nr:3'-5' exonuclease [Longimicrobium sp.]
MRSIVSSEDTPAASWVVIDVEATCDDGGSVPRDEMEIIEIGAVLVAADTLEPVDEFQAFIRPVRHPRLTPFCTRLTSITQEDVDAAAGFAEVFGALCRWIDAHPAPHVFCSWGDYDERQFQQDCAFHGIPYTLPQRHLNLKRAFSQQLGIAKKLGMAGALAHAGLPLAGTHHRGIDDARNIARLLPYALGKATPR